MNLHISVVVPVYNEQARIGGTLEKTRAYLDARGLAAEVLVVDDGSTDGTVALVQDHAARDARIRLLRLPENRGKGAAVRQGMLAAQGERVLFMDADLATPLEELRKLEQALDGGADIAIGSRAHAHSEILVHQQLFREVLGKTFNLMVRVLTGGPYRDTQCGFKLFTQKSARTLFGEAGVDRFAFDVEILLLARGRFSVQEVPVRWRHVEQSKVSPLKDAPRMAFDLLRLRASRLLRRGAGKMRGRRDD